LNDILSGNKLRNYARIKCFLCETAKIQTIENMSEEKDCLKPGEFSWNELIASDEAAQKKFYTGLFGWTAEAFGGGEKRPYTLFKKGDAMVGGMMKRPKPDGPTHWLAYVKVEDVDGVATNAKKLGGKIIVEPMDIPDVGRIAVILDPQGAPIGLYTSAM
jgi:uncharacterized protein